MIIFYFTGQRHKRYMQNVMHTILGKILGVYYTYRYAQKLDSNHASFSFVYII